MHSPPQVAAWTGRRFLWASTEVRARRDVEAHVGGTGGVFLLSPIVAAIAASEYRSSGSGAGSNVIRSRFIRTEICLGLPGIQPNTNKPNQISVQILHTTPVLSHSDESQDRMM